MVHWNTENVPWSGIWCFWEYFSFSAKRCSSWFLKGLHDKMVLLLGRLYVLILKKQDHLTWVYVTIIESRQLDCILDMITFLSTPSEHLIVLDRTDLETGDWFLRPCYCARLWQGGKIPAPIVIYLFPWRFSLYPILPTSSTDFLLYPRALQPPGWDNLLCFLKSTQIFLPSSTSNFYPWGKKKKKWRHRIGLDELTIATIHRRKGEKKASL